MSAYDTLLSCLLPAPSCNVRVNRLRALTLLACAPILLGLSYFNLQLLLKPNFPFNTELVVVAMDGVDVARPGPTMTVTWSMFGPSRAYGTSRCNDWAGLVVVRRGTFRTDSGQFQTAEVCRGDQTSVERRFLEIWNLDMHWRAERGVLIIEGPTGTMHLLRKT